MIPKKKRKANNRLIYITGALVLLTILVLIHVVDSPMTDLPELLKVPDYIEEDASINQHNTFFDYRSMPKGNGTRKEDWFASSFWQTIELFKGNHMKGVSNFEGVFARSTHRGNAKQTRLAYDYLDFSVEHLSKWWKLAGKPTFPYISTKLREYSSRACTRRLSTAMNTTIVVIPFVVAESNDELTQDVWTEALKATMCSVWQHSAKRINVVGKFPFDRTLTVKVLNELKASSQDGVFKLGGTELRFILSDALPTNNQLSKGDEARFKRGDLPVYNVPLAAWTGLHSALINGTESDIWLGGHEYEYVYFSESDQILNARINPQFFKEMQARNVLVPHRLQPIPHRHDFEKYITRQNEGTILPKSFKKVVHLDKQSSCCDTGKHLERFPENCGTFWWGCGLSNRRKKMNLNHLKDYEFMTLEDGTGFTSLSGTEHSRRCKPHVGKRECRPGY